MLSRKFPAYEQSPSSHTPSPPDFRLLSKTGGRGGAGLGVDPFRSNSSRPNGDESGPWPGYPKTLPARLFDEIRSYTKSRDELFDLVRPLFVEHRRSRVSRRPTHARLLWRVRCNGHNVRHETVIRVSAVVTCRYVCARASCKMRGLDEWTE